MSHRSFELDDVLTIVGQTLQLKLIISSLNLAFFLDKLPHPELEGYGTKEAVTRPPLKTFVNLKKWKDISG